jgi:hypothetical protein
MTKQELTAWAERHGFERDKYGHYQKTTATGKRYRIKLQAHSMRWEIRNEEIKEWVKQWGAYYSYLRVNPESDKLQRTVGKY